MTVDHYYALLMADTSNFDSGTRIINFILQQFLKHFFFRKQIVCQQYNRLSNSASLSAGLLSSFDFI